MTEYSIDVHLLKKRKIKFPGGALMKCAAHTHVPHTPTLLAPNISQHHVLGHDQCRSLP